MGVQTDGVEVVKDKKSFFWSGKYHLDMNSRDTLITDLNVLEDFKPASSRKLPGIGILNAGEFDAKDTNERH